jgi:replicative DNA helicase
MANRLFFANSLERYERYVDGEYDPPPLIATGIRNLDVALEGGIQRDKLTVIAARTSHGKTATAVRLAVNMAAQSQVSVLWLEDDEAEFDIRVAAALSGGHIPALRNAYRTKTLNKHGIPREDPRWQRIRTYGRERPYYGQVVEIVRELEPGEVFLIDHLGEINWGDGPKYETMGLGLREIRNEARARKVLVIAMTQLNRDWDRRRAASATPEKVRPCLSDIENSGQIEQVARVCIIAEKSYRKEGEEDVATGEYLYHVFKPRLATARCRWNEATCTPDNPEPVKLAPVQLPFNERGEEPE